MEIGAVNTSGDLAITAYSAQVTSSPQITGAAGKGEAAVKPEVDSAKDAGKKPVKTDNVQQMTDAMNQFVGALNSDIHFVVHDKTKELMVQVVDKQTNKVLKEFPSHEFLDTMAAIRSYIGLLLDKKI